MKPYSKKLKLKIELVPKTSWYNNLRNLLPRSVWDKIRKETFDYYNHKCGICGAEGKLNCHEIWEFDDKNATFNLYTSSTPPHRLQRSRH
jgi:hypothetical protein